MINKKKSTVHYVDNTKLYEEILAHKQRVAEAREKGLPEPRLPNYIGECIWKIAEKLSTKPCFINYSYRDEMVSDGIENCLMYFNDYDPSYNASNNPDYKPNPFAYFTQIIYYAFLRRIGKEEKNRYIIYKNFQHTIIHGTPNGSVDTGSYSSFDDDAETFTPKMYDNINDFMDRFEKKEAIKKEKRKQVKEGLTRFYEE
jgi:hypothetical protein